MNNGYFDIKRDIEVINKGDFFCQACLVGTPASKLSSDPRYCQGCYDLLFNEARLDTGRRKADWKPQRAAKKTAQVSQGVRLIMSIVESGESKVDLIHPPTTFRPSGKRGPKHRPLPEDLIRQLAGEGMGSRAIASQLKRERGIDVSYKTIQRVLAGERN